jgi:hypothetical protein
MHRLIQVNQSTGMKYGDGFADKIRISSSQSAVVASLVCLLDYMY